MKALSIKPQYSELIANGSKKLENRSWGANITGNIALHRCGKNGAIIGVMHISEVITVEEARRRFPSQHKHAFGPLCWVIDKFTPIAEIPCKGKLSLWPAPDFDF